MTISTTASRISHNGNGVTTAFSFPYLFLTNSDLVVIRVAANGTETTLVLNTGYTLTGAGNDAGGTVTILGGAPPSGSRIVIYRAMELTQEVDYITGDPFPAETHERALDRLTMIAQQQQDAIDRSAKLSETSTADADTLVANINSLAAIEDDVSAVAAIDTDVSAVAAIDSNVTTVAGIAANVTTVAGISSNVTTVAGISSNVTTVAGISANVTTVAGVSSAVTTNATNISSINTNASNITAIQNASTNATNAASSASAAQSAQAAAEAARDQTLAVYDSFDDRYLGSKTSDPSVDNDGNALVGGTIYFNSVSGVMRLYTGSQWVAAYVQGVASGIGFTPAGGVAATTVQAAIEEVDTEKLAKAGNLSDVANAATARSNLGAAALSAAQTFTGAQRGAVTALTDGATITPDFAANNNFSVTLGGNRTLANPTNLVAGQSGVIKITQDGTGSRTLAFGSYWDFAAGTAPTLTTTANAVDILAYYVDSTTNITARLIGDRK